MPTTPGGNSTRRHARPTEGRPGTSLSVRPRLLIAALAAAIAVVLAAPAVVGASPLKGDGMWIWRMSDAGGTAESVANKVTAEKYDWVAIKSGDGTDSWSQFTPELVDELHSRDIRVCAWVFVYGAKPEGEAKVSAEAKAHGADCLIIDAEGHYEGRYAAADRYMRKLRKLVGKRYKLGFTSFPYVDFHPALPYSVFLGRDGATFNLPQVYWKTIGDSVRDAYEHTYVWNRPYGRKIFPLGQTYDGVTKPELRNFRRHANEFGAKGVSWWAWHTTVGGEWDAASADVGKVDGYSALEDFVHLNQGARGDFVLQAQQLLRAHKIGSPVNGKLNRKTSEALVKFQRRKKIEQTGELNNPTWRKLLRREPVRIRWDKRKRSTPGFVRSSAAARALAPLEVELPFTPGRP